MQLNAIQNTEIRGVSNGGMQLLHGPVWFTAPSWWRHQMETFSALLAICAGNSPVPGEFPTQRPVTRSFDVFFDLRLNKRLSKQSWGWWFETPSSSLWRHCNVQFVLRFPFGDYFIWVTIILVYMYKLLPFMNCLPLKNINVHYSYFIIHCDTSIVIHPHTKASDAELWCFLWSASE